MGVETILAIIGFTIAVLLTPLYVYLIVKGVRSLSDIRNLLGRPPGDYGQLAAPPKDLNSGWG